MGCVETKPENTKLFVLALGLLVGVVIGFVMLLSSLPVDTSLNDYRASRIENAPAGKKPTFEFYTVLADKVDQVTVVEDITRPAAKVKIPVATRSVPGNVQNLQTQNLATQDYAEIPASSIGQESYYLQAGNYAKVSDAEQRRAEVLLLGIDAFIVKRQNAQGNVGHRVRIGPFVDQNRLTEAKKRLRRANVKYDIIRVTG